MSEWLKETGCKPVGSAYAGSNPAPPTTKLAIATPVSGVTTARGAEGRHRLTPAERVLVNSTSRPPARPEDRQRTPTPGVDGADSARSRAECSVSRKGAPPQARPARFPVLVQAGASGTRAETLARRPERSCGEASAEMTARHALRQCGVSRGRARGRGNRTRRSAAGSPERAPSSTELQSEAAPRLRAFMRGEPGAAGVAQTTRGERYFLRLRSAASGPNMHCNGSPHKERPPRKGRSPAGEGNGSQIHREPVRTNGLSAFSICQCLHGRGA
jgi:hypothetical protein